MRLKPRTLLVDTEPGRLRDISNRLTATGGEPIEATSGYDDFPPPLQRNPEKTAQAKIALKENAQQESERSHNKLAYAWIRSVSLRRGRSRRS